MAGSEDRIENLAGAILDGGRVDWAAAESDADLDARLLDQLRVLATVAALHRLPQSSIIGPSPRRPWRSRRRSSTKSIE